MEQGFSSVSSASSVVESLGLLLKARWTLRPTCLTLVSLCPLVLMCDPTVMNQHSELEHRVPHVIHLIPRSIPPTFLSDRIEAK